MTSRTSLRGTSKTTRSRKGTPEGPSATLSTIPIAPRGRGRRHFVRSKRPSDPIADVSAASHSTRRVDLRRTSRVETNPRRRGRGQKWSRWGDPGSIADAPERSKRPFTLPRRRSRSSSEGSAGHFATVRRVRPDVASASPRLRCVRGRPSGYPLRLRVVSRGGGGGDRGWSTVGGGTGAGCGCGCGDGCAYGRGHGHGR